MFPISSAFFKPGAEVTKLGIKKLGNLIVSMEGLGCMGMSEYYGDANVEESLATLEKAFAEGINFFDTADVYGSGENERLVGSFVAKHRREQLVIATKCGVVQDESDVTKMGVNNKPDYIVNCCEQSLKRLGLSYIDLYYLHRINEKDDGQGAPLDISMQAFAKLLEQGKIRHVGISEASADQIQRAHMALLKYTGGKHGLTAVQMEYSLLSRTSEIDGVLAKCRELGVGLVAYSPLSRKLLTGVVKNPQTDFSQGDARHFLPRFVGENAKANLDVVGKIENIAQRKGCTVGQVALAWVMAQGDYIVPIPGTKRVAYLEENVAAARVILSKEDLLELDKIAPVGVAVGARYPELYMEYCHQDVDVSHMLLQKTL